MTQQFYSASLSIAGAHQKASANQLTSSLAPVLMPKPVTTGIKTTTIKEMLTTVRGRQTNIWKA